MTSSAALESLLLSLFKKDELLRFARQFYGARIAQIVQAEKSDTAAAIRLASELVERNRVDGKLFDALLATRPDHAQAITQARDAILSESAKAQADPNKGLESPSPPPAAPLSDPQSPKTAQASTGAPNQDGAKRAWSVSLKALFDSLPAIDEQPPPQWAEAAAVLPHFKPLELRPLGGAKDKDDGLTKLANFCDVPPDGDWILQLRYRREAISRLWKEDRLDEALSATRRLDPKSPHRSILNQIAAKKAVKVGPESTYDYVLAARDVGEWFATSDVSLINLDKISTQLERHQSIEPLRKLTGNHFRGRRKELKLLRAHQRAARNSRRVLTITGIGGSGKSALLGKLLLELERYDGLPPPWVYLDLDHPEVEPDNPKKLIELIARRLGLLYAGDESSRLFHQLESAAAGDPLMASDLGLRPGAAPLDDLIRALDRLIRRLPSKKPSLLLVFDTFEQAQVRGPAVMQVFVDTIQRILSVIPYAQVVISGRGSIDAFDDTIAIHLVDLDQESADAVLQALGISAAKTRQRIIQSVGRNPLSLHLCASAIKLKQINVADLELFTAGTRRVELQGRLYTRFLGHIKDDEVRRLAHPGLVVRRVTPAIIREVLSEICEIDPSHADALFAKLPDHVALFSPDDKAPDEPDALRHRQDLRETMVGLMVADPNWKGRLQVIHGRAIDHYKNRPHPIARAEELYHRLMRDDPLEELDRIWSTELIPSISRSWLEPIPDRARSWLAVRLGRKQPISRKDLRQADWEADADRRARSCLDVADFDGALAVLAERSDRLAGSTLIPLEVQALRGKKRAADALKVCRRALVKTSKAHKLDASLQLHLLAAELAVELKKPSLIEHHCQRARKLAVSLHDQAAELRALELQVRGDKSVRTRARAASREHLRQLERTFVRTKDEVLWKTPDLAAQVFQTLGAQSKLALKKMATTFGNRPEQTVIRTDAYQMADLLRRVSEKEGGSSVLGDLATTVGLSSEKYDVQELANNAIRFSRQGDTLATVLDAFGDDDDVRSAAAGLIK